MDEKKKQEQGLSTIEKAYVRWVSMRKFEKGPASSKRLPYNNR